MADLIAFEVLLTHGFNDAVGCFTNVVERLPPHWEVVGFDLPAHGDSNLPEEKLGSFIILI